MPETLLHRWNNWEGGVGYPIEEGRNGMHTANKVLGLRGELRPAPKATDVTVAADEGHHYQYFFEEPRSVVTAPTFDAGSSGTDTSATTLTISHTTGSGENRLLVGVCAVDTTDTVTATSGGVAMRQLGSKLTGGNTGRVFIFLLENPSTGAADVVFTATGTQGAICGIVASFAGVDQGSPTSNASTGAAENDAGPITCAVISAATELVIDGAMCTDTVQTMTVGAGQTECDANLTAGDVRVGCSYETGAASTTMSWTLGAASDWGTFAFGIVGAPTPPSYLYATRGKRAGSTSRVKVNKVSLGYGDFANLETGEHNLNPLTVPGQPVRYLGFWWFPMGDNQKARRLQVVGDGAIANDTLDATATALGADHFANLGSQVVSTLTHSGNDDGGLRILKVAGDIGTEADWGSPFAVGDRTERSAGVRSLGDLAFVMQIEGLYSCNKSARYRLVFEDFRAWRHAFDNIPITPYKGGLAISHPTGLLFWEPGRLPVNVGLNANIGSSVLSPSGPTGLRGGRYHGLCAAGDFLWHIYQPDLSSTTANVMVAYPRENSPYDLVFQQLGTTTLQDADHMLGCFVSVGSKPLSAEYVTPTLWYGNDDDLSYVVLGTTASPFRTRADTHVVEAAGDAYLSELMFENPTELSRAVVYAQNMVSGDEWQLKVLADGEEETNLGPPIKSNGRHEITIDRHDVYRLMFHVNWSTTVTTARAAPSVMRIDLYGDPGRELPSA